MWRRGEAGDGGGRGSKHAGRQDRGGKATKTGRKEAGREAEPREKARKTDGKEAGREAGKAWE